MKFKLIKERWLQPKMEQFTDKLYIKRLILENAVREKIEKPKVSVIVPVYNTEKYLFKCLMSLIRQTLKEIEIIIVNDGSTDNSSYIISEFEKKDVRIKVVNQENRLQGAARNVGMKFATGEYIGFVDSDDWVDLDYFEKLYLAAKKYNANIAMATNVRIGNGKTKKRLNIEKEECKTNLQEKFDICNLAKNPCPTNKIYELSLILCNDIQWPEGCYCEDKLFVTKAVYYSNGVVAVPNINYYYFRNPDSTVNSKKKKHSRQMLDDKNKARASVVEFLRNVKADIKDTGFKATKKELSFFGLTWFRIQESILFERILIFGIPVYTRRIVG